MRVQLVFIILISLILATVQSIPFQKAKAMPPNQPCEKVPGEEHTPTYYNYKEGKFTDTIFLPHTYIYNILNDPTDDILCMKIDRIRYVNFLTNHNIQCNGSWCIYGEFACGEFPNCYHVEHIIDRSNAMKELDGYNKDILGNVVMAYSKWNSQVGQLVWPYVEAEKREIYGDRIMDFAISSIRKCHEYNYGSDKDFIILDTEDVDCNLPEDNDVYILKLVYWLIGIIVVIAIVIFLLILYIFKCMHKNYMVVDIERDIE